MKLNLSETEFMFLYQYVLTKIDNIETEEKRLNANYKPQYKPQYKAMLTRLKNKMEKVEDEHTL